MPSDIANIMAAGRLVGMEFIASAADQVSISPGTVLLPDGVVILEDKTQTLQISNTAFSVSYTVVYQLQSSTIIGGSPATLLLLTGIIKQSTLTDATVLGWIIYPGNAVALDPSMFLQPRPIRVDPPEGVLHTLFLPPFVEGLRPPAEKSGSVSTKSVRVTNLNTTSLQTVSFGGVPTRILGATVVTDVGIASNVLNYDVLFLNKSFVVTGNLVNGSNILSNLSDTTQITIGQQVRGTGIPNGATVVSAPSGGSVTISGNAGSTLTASPVTFSSALYSLSTATTSLVAGLPQPLSKTVGAPISRYVIGATDTLSVSINPNPPAHAFPAGSISGGIDIAVEMPAKSGNWQEQIVSIGTETALQFLNVSTSTLTYDLKLPFVITGEGQPHKLITRLNVDFNTIVTFTVLVGNKILILSPVSGSVANTGGLVTMEFAIPNNTVTWTNGTMAYIDVSIQAQGGGSASFSFIGLTLEDAPYPLFVP
jgi:hypothetical protein